MKGWNTVHSYKSTCPVHWQFPLQKSLKHAENIITSCVYLAIQTGDEHKIYSYAESSAFVSLGSAGSVHLTMRLILAVPEEDIAPWTV